ncbi:serine/threonine-protein kinase [Hyalangium versicolor]|uniref:serine/threonine-protein kinase n=1 Tax=Hyalangium versicolor TaxID=2861190 RepID=UPI001CCE58A4|nr:serine/threonine-protein kinase [Hyalangium versicolor]
MLGQQLGEYVVRRFIGSGGMGIVYAGEHVTIGRKVAIKFIREEVSQGPLARDLLTEARAAGAIHHHGIIDIFGFGQQPGVGQYLVMEYLEGRPLSDVLQERGPLPLAESLALLCEVLDALSAAHAAGVIHRDLKPSNIFVVRQSNGAEYIKVLDFGLAKRSATPEGTTPQTYSDVIVGTPQYMAPEQALGEEVGPQTDLYAVGVIAFELLTGRRPFSGRTHMEVVAHHLKTPAPAPSVAVAVPAEVDALVLQLLAKEPRQRPASAAEVGRRLRALLQSQEAGGLPVAGTSRSIPVLKPPPAAVSPQALTETMQPTPTPDSPQAGAPLPPAVRGSRWKWGTVAGSLLLLALGGAMVSRSTFASMASSPLPAATAAASPVPVPPAAQPEARRPSPEPAPTTPTPEPAQPLALAPPPKVTAKRPVPGPRAPQKKTPAPAQPSAPAIASVQPSSSPPEQAPVPAATGTLHILVKGAWADVWIDGQKLGRVPPTHSYTLSAGAHEVELRNPALAPYQQKLVIPPGGTLTHKADLSLTP